MRGCLTRNVGVKRAWPSLLALLLPFEMFVVSVGNASGRWGRDKSDLSGVGSGGCCCCCCFLCCCCCSVFILAWLGPNTTPNDIIKAHMQTKTSKTAESLEHFVFFFTSQSTPLLTSSHSMHHIWWITVDHFTVMSNSSILLLAVALSVDVGGRREKDKAC
jgi:hypothetical protein